MSSYKFIQFVSEFIKTRQSRFYFHKNFFNQLYCVIIEKDNKKDENLGLVTNLKKL